MFLGWDSSAAVLLFRLQINMRAAVRVTLLKGAVMSKLQHSQIYVTVQVKLQVKHLNPDFMNALPCHAIATAICQIEKRVYGCNGNRNYVVDPLD